MIDFTTPILDLDSVPLRTVNQDGTPTDQFLLLSKVCCDALLASYKDEENLSGDDKCRRVALALKIKGSTPEGLDLKSEEKVELKKLVNKAWGVLVVFRAFELIEGATASAKQPAAPSGSDGTTQ